jgi:Asp-tRNA(Asn)/Glu-tRNA(Gln) amidotransferase A subunit family amidase
MAFPLDAAAFADLEPVDLSRLRVAVTPDLGGVLVSRAVAQTFADRVERLGRLVGRCEAHPIDLSAAPGVDWALRQDVFVAQYARDAERWDEGFNPNIRQTYDDALRTEMVDIAKARRLQVELYRRFAAVFDDVDLVVCPGVSIPPFPWRHLNPQEIDGRPVENYMAWLGLTASITVIGHPVVALPCGLDGEGMPFGIQVIGPMFGDRAVLSAAAALEAAFAADPVTARPTPDLNRLAAQPLAPFDPVAAG